MMRAFENRPDCAVSDEPFYGHYLVKTGLAHPAAEDVIASQSGDWQSVVKELIGPIPDDLPIWYQKHMTQHMLPEMGREWLPKVKSCFLIRDPHEVLASYVKRRQSVTLDDLGFCQQTEIFNAAWEYDGVCPPVIDSGDLLRQPEKILRKLCAALGIEFSGKMLKWPAGPRESDGVWAPHWYASVEASTGFMPWKARARDYPPSLQPLIDEAMPYYETLYAHRITAEGDCR